jgi:integrase
MIGDVPAADWFCSLHAVLWCSGERIGALLKARWPDVDLSSGWLTIQPDDRKGGCVGRVYRLTPDAREWLARIKHPTRELVWPWPLSHGRLWGRYRELLNDAGLESGRDRMFHCVRKSHASHLEAAGGNATESLGHKSRQTTIDSYLDVTITGAGDQTSKLFPLGDSGDGPRAA